MTPRKLFHPALDTRQQVVLSSSGLSSSTVTLVREPWKRRSDYADNIAAKPGTRLICKSCGPCEGFTEGASYEVAEGGRIINDNGEAVYSSARFYQDPAKAGRPADQRVVASAKSAAEPLSPGTEGPQAGQLIQRRLDKQAGNTSRAVIRRRATVHSILAGGQGNG
jgi:hypothetical protein